ncbi:MAG: serine hydrolase domain-containing protein [Dehalococcoidia bacterium]
MTRIRPAMGLSVSKTPSRRTLLRIAAGGALTAAVALASGVRPRLVHAGEPTFSAEIQTALSRILARHMMDQGIPGVVAGVWIPGRGNWVGVAGTSDTATGAPLLREDKFRIASVTKTFTATAVLQLVDDGKLSLDDHLEQYITGIPNGDQITIRQLLGMMAGIFNWIEDPAFMDAYGRDPLLPFTPQDVVEIVRRHPPDFAPGERVQYSDTNYILLGLIIEQVTGRPAGEVITEHVIRPLGLTNTSFPTTPAMPSPYSHGYAEAADGTGLRDVTLSNPDVPWTAGAIISDLGDLRVWAKALATGTLLSPATQRERLTFRPEPGTGAGYGLGIFDVDGFIGHNGAIFGYSTWVVYLPEEEATIVVLTNRAETETETATGIFADIARLLFPGRLPPPQ